MQQTARAKHLGYLDGLRGLAALYVVLHHAYSYVKVGIHDSMPPIVSAMLDFFDHGRYSVAVFIVLSGFCLMLPVARGDGTLGVSNLAFFKRRAWRILPTYYLALLFSWALATSILRFKTGTLWDLSIPATPKSLVPHLLLIHDLLGEDNTINYVFWSIAVEWRIYFLFPLLLAAWRSLGGVTATILAVVASYVLFFVAKQYDPAFSGRPFDPEGLTAYYIGLFALGLLSASIAFSDSECYRRLRNCWWRPIILGLTQLVLFPTILQAWNGVKIPYPWQEGFVGLWTAALLVFLARSEKGWAYRLLNHQAIVWVGSFAYSLYLIHAPLLQVLWQTVFAPLQGKPLAMFGALSLLGTPLILGISYGFFRLCERPFLRRKARATELVTVETASNPAP